jgi:hypothetical protein
MSIKVIKEQIDRFLQSDTPEVMVIKGAWGVGKTFAWNKYLIEAKDAKQIVLGRCSYVSLFGLNSLEALKFKIFEQTVDKTSIGKPSADTFKSNSVQAITSLGKKSISLFSGATFFKSFEPAIESLSSFFLNKTIVCIDDFERIGKGVQAQDVMGLLTTLKEQKECKVVLILNEDFLEGEALKDYKKFREKLIDMEILYNPSAQECAGIVLPDFDDDVESKLRGFVISLGINNIRIINRIKRLAKIIVPLLAGLEQEVTHQALHTLTLFVWCFYDKGELVPDYDFVKKFRYRFLDDKEKPKEETLWEIKLGSYEYFNTNEFDLQVARVVECGYVDKGLFLDEANKLHERIVASKSESSFSEAWKPYHESFDDNGNEVALTLYDSFKRNVKNIATINFDSTVRLFRELGKNDWASEIIDLYIDERKEELKFDRYSLDGYSKDKEIIEKFNAAGEALKEIRTITDVLEKLKNIDGWGRDDVAVLSAATPDDFYEIFKSKKGPHLSSYVDVCLQFEKIGGTSEKEKKISENAIIALKRIGNESTINKLRIRKFGVKLDAEEGEADTSQ